VKTSKIADNAWLLIKHPDQFAGKDDMLMEESSVVSGKKLEDFQNEN
jgi:hypothetical protein